MEYTTYNLGVAVGYQFERRVAFRVAEAAEVLRAIPAVPGVLCLRGEDEAAQPYLTRGADLRRRAVRLLAPPEAAANSINGQSKRLNLRERVAWVEWTATGSEFEAALVLYGATSAIFGVAEARRRLKLYTPYCVRMSMENAYPRVYTTNRLSKRGLGEMYGPFPSRAAAERYCDAVLDLYKLRRCWEELVVSPEHPGCAYGEMKKCMRPCQLACTAEEYGAEALAVKAFFETRGESLLGAIAAEREAASAEMEFERAAELHQHYTKVKAAAGLADELVRPLAEVRAVVVQKAAGIGTRGGPTHHEGQGRDEWGTESGMDAAVFLFEGGGWVGPGRLSVLGVRAVKEQTSVGTSLFAQPLMLQAVPEGDGPVTAVESPEVRAAGVLASLRDQVGGVVDVAVVSDHLSLLRRWYYRPEKQRVGEVFLPNADGGFSVRRVLNGAARVVLGAPKEMAETQREAAAVMKATATAP